MATWLLPWGKSQVSECPHHATHLLGIQPLTQGSRGYLWHHRAHKGRMVDLSGGKKHLKAIRARTLPVRVCFTTLRVSWLNCLSTQPPRHDPWARIGACQLREGQLQWKKTLWKICKPRLTGTWQGRGEVDKNQTRANTKFNLKS